jgi:hypothetical protein
MTANDDANRMSPPSAAAAGPSRRDVVEGSLAGLAAAAIPPIITAGAAAAAPPHIETDEDIDRLLPRISNWGRWGKDDQRGTLNYITDETRSTPRTCASWTTGCAATRIRSQRRPAASISSA